MEDRQREKIFKAIEDAFLHKVLDGESASPQSCHENKSQTQWMISNYEKLETLAEQGCMTALCVKADITNALRVNPSAHRLTTRQSQVVFCHLILGESQDDVAHRLGVSQPNVSKCFNAALSKLHWLLREYT